MCETDSSDEFELVTLPSGVRTLRSIECGETFHPVIGPVAEARALHVAQQRLRERAAAARESFIVWDVGLGAAANAIALLEEFGGVQPSVRVELLSFERTLAPLRFALREAEALGYLAPHRGRIEQLLASRTVACGAVRWSLHLGDFREALATPGLPAPHAILYDPYSPRANPELWTLEHFTALSERLSCERSCLLSTYTRSTAVRVALLLAGLFVGRGAATGEKDETTLAANKLALLEAPLGHEWLARVERSTRSAPLRTGGGDSRISAEELARLCAHPQFA